MTSQLHERTKDLVIRGLGVIPAEEVNVRKLFPKYKYRTHRYDLVIPQFRLIIECHGRQHSTLQTFGGDEVETYIKLQQQKKRDIQKEDIAWENGWGYVVIWFNDFPKDDNKAMEILMGKISSAIELITN